MTQTGKLKCSTEDAVRLGQAEVEIVPKNVAENDGIRSLLRAE